MSNICEVTNRKFGYMMYPCTFCWEEDKIGVNAGVNSRSDNLCYECYYFNALKRLSQGYKWCRDCDVWFVKDEVCDCVDLIDISSYNILSNYIGIECKIE